MSNIFIDFKNMLKGESPDASVLVPMLKWASGSEKNILMCQNVNRKFFNGNHKVYIHEVTLLNNVHHVIKFPKKVKKDDKLDFFYDDVSKYFGWSSRELDKNISVLDIGDMKETIARVYGYDNTQRRKLGLEAINYGKKKTGRPNRTRVEEAETNTERSQTCIEQFKERDSEEV